MSTKVIANGIRTYVHTNHRCTLESK